MTCRKRSALLAFSAVLSLTNTAGLAIADPALIENLDAPAKLTPAQFAEYHALIKPAADESPWAKIPWQASVWEARRMAAAEGKPILIWSGGGSPPLGVC